MLVNYLDSGKEDSFEIGNALEEPFRTLENIGLEGLDPLKETLVPLDSGVENINAVQSLH